jgi:elongation factor Ts
MVKDLRERTGAGMLDCKKALEENKGDFDNAIDWLRKKGISKAAKKADRVAAEGTIASYVHGEGRIGVLVEINSETDFVARNDQFRNFVSDIAMHIAASSPLCVREEDIPADIKNREREILIAKAREEGKPDAMIEKIVGGQMNKWMASQCLLTQPYVKNPDKTIGEYLQDTIATIGENLVIRRFARYELGEGIEKRKDDFAAEVAAQLKG